VRVDDAIEATPKQSGCLLDEIQNEWNGFGREEGIEAKDTGGGDVTRGEDRDCECRFYFAVFECFPSDVVVNEFLKDEKMCLKISVTYARSRKKITFLSHLDRTPNGISRTKRPTNRSIEGTDRCVPTKVHQFIDLRIGIRRRNREQTIQCRITIAVV